MNMLSPKKTKFRKQMRGRMQGNAQSGNKISFGYFALQASDRGYLTTRQIEAARRVITRTLKRGGKTWIRVFPDKSVTKIPAEKDNLKNKIVDIIEKGYTLNEKVIRFAKVVIGN